jgi:hypothetical protein
VLREQSRTEGDLEALPDKRKLPLLPGQRNDKTDKSRRSPFRLRVARTVLEALLHDMFLLERRATLRRRHLRSYEAKMWRTAMILINA